ncbi:MAG TPA: peptidylprolyl isomerase [Xanthobacteraceae bacterium]|nr:peptidylprolyl isomerase [Xanthobacteraceae bacterium]
MKRLAALALLLLVAFVPAASAQLFQQQPKLDPQNTLVMETTKGRVVIKLRPDLAPRHAERLKQLARDGYYNNVPFHRVILGFMAQTGDGEHGDGTGKSRYPDLPAEFSNVPFVRGVVGMARSQSPNSANSQFFIMYDNTPSLNGQYTVVGEVVSGMEAIDDLTKGPSSLNGRVTNPDRIITVRVAADIKQQ